MNKTPLLVGLLAVSILSACQESETVDTTADLDGVWRGVLSGKTSHESLQAHVLDGLVLTVGLDADRAHSAELVLDHGDIDGVFAQRAAAGERDRDYTLIGHAHAYDRIEADLISGSTSKSLSLFYDENRSFAGASYRAIAGIYTYYGDDLQLVLSIYQDGHVEAYDDAGCSYFGDVEIPDSRRNIYALSLDVSGCAMEGEYGFGLASLDYDAYGVPQLSLPIWFDNQDRVEAWTLQRE